MSTALTVHNGEPPVQLQRAESQGLAPMAFNDLVGMGEQLVRTGFLPEHIRNGAQAAAIIMTGRELGMQPMRALRSLVMVKGKVTENADSQLARFKADGGRAIWKRLDEKAAELYLKHPNGDEHTETFTLEDAERAGLTKPGRNGEPSMYSKHPKAMLRSRAITAALKSIGWEGGVGAYDPDEVIAFAPATSDSAEPSAAAGGEYAAGDSIDDRAPLDGPEASCPKCGGRMWDNRTSKTNVKAPDYKCRDRQCDGAYWPGQWPPAPVATESQKKRIEELLAVADLSEKRAATIRKQMVDTEKPLNAKRADEIIEGLRKLVPSKTEDEVLPLDMGAFNERVETIGALLKHDKFTTDEVKSYTERAAAAETVEALDAIVVEIQRFIDSPF